MINKRVLCLDVGDRRIGVAISDELGVTARGLFTLKRTNIKSDTDKIIETIRENDCSHVIIGLPLNLSGTDSVQTEKVRSFAEKLGNKLVSNAMQEIALELYDERYSTVIAEQTMKEIGIKRKKITETIDQQAAVVILQDWLLCFGNSSESSN